MDPATGDLRTAAGSTDVTTADRPARAPETATPGTPSTARASLTCGPGADIAARTARPRQPEILYRSGWHLPSGSASTPAPSPIAGGESGPSCARAGRPHGPAHDGRVSCRSRYRALGWRARCRRRADRQLRRRSWRPPPQASSAGSPSTAGIPAARASRSSSAIEYPGVSARARSSATLASAPSPHCHAVNASKDAGAAT